MSVEGNQGERKGWIAMENPVGQVSDDVLRVRCALRTVLMVVERLVDGRWWATLSFRTNYDEEYFDDKLIAQDWCEKKAVEFLVDDLKVLTGISDGFDLLLGKPAVQP